MIQGIYLINVQIILSLIRLDGVYCCNESLIMIMMIVIIVIMVILTWKGTVRDVLQFPH